MRRRRAAISARERWTSGLSAYCADALNSQGFMALATPRVGRIIDLLELRPGRRYLDIGCGTGAFADLIAADHARHQRWFGAGGYHRVAREAAVPR